MKYNIENNKIKITDINDFNLQKTFECGQCFRWNKDKNGAYVGIAYGKPTRLYQENNSIIITSTAEDFEKTLREYFDLDRDYNEIMEKVSIDDYMKRATSYGAGLRLLRQETWEALCSFIISQNNNIPRIKRIISTLCERFGDNITFNGDNYYTFPSAKTIASLKPSDLAPLRCGYRADYIISAAGAVASGDIDLDALAKKSPIEARTALKRLHGVGDKVADCVLLFGLHMLDAFPIDVWVKRVVEEQYGKNFDPGVFSPYAGVAQQYMFYYARNHGNT